MRHYNIPIFLPELACPFRCVYCNQNDITGFMQVPKAEEVVSIIEQHLETIPVNNSYVEIAFFGGNFTGLSLEKQNKFLSIAHNYLKTGKVRGVRLSTRPDYITGDILDNLKIYGVTAIELGAQSLDEEVLSLIGRGHTAKDVKKAGEMINKNNFELGIQMMTGLPGDSKEKAINTAEKIIALNAYTTRIYPTLVINNSELANMYRKGNYKPQSIEEAVELCAELFLLFENAGVKVLRMGLHPTEAFYDSNNLLAGPFHPAFGELVMTKVWQWKIERILKSIKGKKLEIFIHPTQMNAAIGHKAANRKYFEKAFEKVYYHADKSLNKDQFYVDYS